MAALGLVLDQAEAAGSAFQQAPGDLAYWMATAAKPSQAYPLDPATATSALIVGGRGILTGLAFTQEGTAGASDFRLLDGTDSGGIDMGSFQVPSGGALTLWLGPDGVRFSNGLYIAFVASTKTLRGAVYVKL